MSASVTLWITILYNYMFACMMPDRKYSISYITTVLYLYIHGNSYSYIWLASQLSKIPVAKE